MIYVFAVIYFLQAYGLVMAIRRLMGLQKQVRKDMGRIDDLRGRNAELLSKMVDHTSETQDTQKYYRHLFNRTNEMVYVHSITKAKGPGRFLEVNDYMCERLGYPRDEFLKLTPLDIEVDKEIRHSEHSGPELGSTNDEYLTKYMEEALRHSVARRVAEVLEHGHAVSQRAFKVRGGNLIPVEISARRLEMIGGPVIMCTAYDLTTRLAYEKALRDTQQRLADFFGRSSFGIAIYDGRRKLVDANSACLKMFGFLDSDQMGEFSLFDNPYVPADVRKKMLDGENQRYEMTVNFDELVRTTPCLTARKGKGWFKVAMNNMGHDRDKRPRGYFAELQDISEHRRVEEQLRQLQMEPVEGREPGEGISGSLRDMGFTDMIQVLSAGGKSAEITLERENLSARVLMQEGSIVHAELNDKVGEEVFYSLMRWRDGDFVIKQCAEFPTKTITTSTMGLLMEGARQADEGG